MAMFGKWLFSSFLVTFWLLAFFMRLLDTLQALIPKNCEPKPIVQINREKEREKERIGGESWKPKLNSIYSSFSSLYSDVGVSKGGQTRKGRGNESAEVKMELKISCAKALWMLANDSVANSHRITETKGLLSLAKLIERETGELRKICVMAVMEITLAAESKADLRRSAFKTSSPAGKAVVVQLVRVIKESSDPALQIAAIKSIGCLSRTFSAKETRVIGPLVEQLSSNNHEVGTEAAVALAKFVDPENFLCHEHSKAIIEFDGVVPLLRLLRESERAQVNGLVLLCHLAINAGNSEALERARLLTALEGTDRNLTAQYPQLRELIVKAMYHLGLYHGDAHPLRLLDTLQALIPKNCEPKPIVQINREKEREKERIGGESWKPKLNSIYSSFSSLYSDVGVSKGGQTRKGRGNESAEVKMELKISCAKALWMLANDSVANSHRITETKGLLSLAKLIERETGELRKICVMAVMEITLAAESKADLRRSAFKTSSPAGKAVVVQLVRVIKESSDPALQIAAIKSIGCLSRTFSAKETRVIGPLVEQLSSNNHEVGTEAAVALAKFVDPENFLCHEHSKAIIEFDGVVPLLRLLRESERAQVNGLVLLCHLAINAGNSEALERARLLTALEGTDRNLTAQYPQLRELIVKAMYHLGLYHGDAHPLRQASLRI
ncbi:uncharacterized protein LOC110713596 [Chenopodium quinoa]|uniref:uncharacterized protein LOC110713596 n=1 Tax=Chenopodium quinoa TaxID=63459 RepID=UPI000B782713|nr:uncharacterized protein LOC110713596 [Chenopodium quinoa]